MTLTGKLIAIEGTTDTALDALAKKLYRWLRERDVAIELTGEPTYGPVGAQLRLYQQGRIEVDATTLALFDIADRMDHLGRADGMLAWLAEGRTVLCARYLAYSFAWHLDRVDLHWLQQINARCRVPDLTLFLDVEPDATTAGLEKNYCTALDALQSRGHNVLVIDGRDGGERLFERCCRHIAAL